MNLTLILLVALALLLVIDWRQTLVISRHPELYFERNPALGRHPEQPVVHGYFAFCFIGGGLWFAALWWLGWITALNVMAGLWTAAQAVCVVNNYRLGIKP